MTVVDIAAAFPHAPPGLAERFATKIAVTGHCWLWADGADGNYANFRIEGIPYRAHRLAWTWATGYPLIKGAHVHHRCRVRRCVNPDHLELVSAKGHLRKHDHLPPSFFARRESFQKNQPVEVDAPRTCRRCGCRSDQQTVGCHACRMRARYRQDVEDALNEKAGVA